MDISSISQNLFEKGIWAILLASAGGLAVAVRSWFRKVRGKRAVKAADGTQFAILVAQLDGDANRSQTKHILAELEKQFPPHGAARLHVLPYTEVLAIGVGERTVAIAAAEAQGRKWLRQKNADVLIWGEVGAADRVLRLRFLAPEGDPASAKPYALNAELTLPPEFGADLGAILALQAATSIAPVYERSGEALADLIGPVVAKLKPLAENPPTSFSSDTRAQLWHAYALGEDRLGGERGENARLVNAIDYYRKVLEEWTRERVPLYWATTQNNLGTALRSLGERESGTARLEEAVAAFREALEERTRERVPLGWATAQNNLGTALAGIGKRESSTARLEEAVAAFREALKERTRERVPLDWATTQNNLGNALADLGERESGTARLKEAVAAFREALKERTRERVPLGWATTQNNLGTALARLGERESTTARLEEAAAAFREALMERTRERVPLDWATTQNNLGNALGSLGERESATARLEESVAAFREALKERTRERVPLDWAMTQNNLGTALARLGERESATARLEEAVAAFREALKERTRKRVPLGWAMTQNNLGNVLQSLGRRQAAADKAKGCAALEAAREHFAAALEEFRKAGAAYYVDMVEGNIARLEADVERLCG
jgi:tetratricopeptide (TPR) repeat protein